MKQKPNKREIERQLLPKLKWMGYIFFFLAIGSLLFAILVEPEESTAEEFASVVRLQERLFGKEAKADPLPHEVLNFYAVAAVFATIGLLVLLLVWKKSKALLKTDEEEQ